MQGFQRLYLSTISKLPSTTPLRPHQEPTIWRPSFLPYLYMEKKAKNIFQGTQMAPQNNKRQQRHETLKTIIIAEVVVPGKKNHLGRHAAQCSPQVEILR